MQKPLPTPSLHLTLHPEQDREYRHFENGAAHPFRGDESLMTRCNAWWLADAALLSYWPAKEAVKRFGSAGFEARALDGGSTNVYVAVAPSGLIVSFRGTQPNDWGDVLDDLAFVPVAAHGGMVHGGFAKALERVWSQLVATLAECGDRPVWFCGHSLGGALAMLAAARCRSTAGVCTIGSPRVGDDVFVAHFDERFGGRSWRYVHDHDIVTHVPPPKLIGHTFAHVTERRFIDADGKVGMGKPAIPHFFGDIFGSVTGLCEQARTFFQGGLKLAPDCLLDHMPRYYATVIWNDYDANG